MFKNILNKGRFMLVGAIMAFAMIASAATTLMNNTTAAAASSCDKVNIVYCGVNKGSLSSDINSFKDYYNTNKSGHKSSPTVKKDYTDIQAVYNWAGASKSIVSGMTTSNTKLGTLYKDGRIVVNGQTVGTDAWVSARFNSGSGFTHVTSNVYARKTTTSFANSSAPVLVYFNGDKMGFAVMLDCGNAVKATPKTTPKPVASMSCDLLTLDKKGDKDFGFNAKASVKNATIKNYSFDFGDGQNKDVPTSATSASTSHSYAKAGTYTASVKVTVVADGKTKTVTSAKCAVQVKIAQPECKPGIPVGDQRCEEKPVYACNELVITATENNTKQYNFTVKATAENAVINGYTVDFGDGTAAYEGTDGSVDHTYAKAGTYTAKASVKVTANGKTVVVSGDKCVGQVTIPETPTPPETPETPSTPETPAQELPNTGAGNMIGLFSGFSIAGTAAHRLFTRRRSDR